MAKKRTILEVFVASPSDVNPEREVLGEVVSEFNSTWGEGHEVRLDLIKWETHSRPAVGQDAQSFINQQIGDEYDIFIGIMWGRFGSETPRAGSGTQEEFQRVYSRLRDGEKVEVMFYFKDAGIPPSKIDGSQLEKVQAFKKQISEEHGGLYADFETTDDFRTKVRLHLSRVVQDWFKSNAGENQPDKPRTIERVEKPEESNPLANLDALEHEDSEIGYMDLVDIATTAMDAVAHITDRITNATLELGIKISKRSEALQPFKVRTRTKSDFRKIKRIQNDAALDLEQFVKRLSLEIPDFQQQSSIAMDAFGKVAMLTDFDIEGGGEGTDAARSGINSLLVSMDSAFSSVTGFRESMNDLPNMTTEFNRAKRRSVAIVDDLLAQYRITISQTKDVQQLMSRIVNPDSG